MALTVAANTEASNSRHSLCNGHGYREEYISQ